MHVKHDQCDKCGPATYVTLKICIAAMAHAIARAAAYAHMDLIESMTYCMPK